MKKKDRISISAKIQERKQNKTKQIVYGVLILVSFVLYGNTLGHDYALDDAYVITQNEFTKQGLAGVADIFSSDQFAGKYGDIENVVAGGRYRPLSIFSFSIEYHFFGESPGFFYFFNIIFFAITGILLYLLFLKLIPGNKNQNPYLSIPFLTALLFLAHPIHTEVVANIKGRDEIFALIGSLYASLLTLKYLETKYRKYLFYSGIVFFLGLLSKENTITFVAIIPLTIYFFTDNKLRETLISLIPIGIATVVFLIIRQLVIGGGSMEIEKELLNNPFLNATIAERFATVFYTLGLYLKLLIYPHPLTFDYYPYHIPLMSWGDWKVLLAVLSNLALLVYAIVGIKNKNKIAYAIWFYFLPLSIVSNLLFPVGVFMNERFIYFSSIGFSFALAFLLIDKLQAKIANPQNFKRIIYYGLGIFILLLSAKTIHRNFAWKNNETLFSTDVITSSNSIKSNAGYAEILYHKGEKVTDTKERKKLLEQSIHYFQQSIKIHPEYVNAMLLLANAWFEYDRSVDSTLNYYLRILELQPKMYDVYRNMKVVIASLNDADKELEYYHKFLKANPKRFETNYQVGLFYARRLNDYENGIKYLNYASQLKPSNIDVLKDLGMAYGLSKQYDNALEVFLRAVKFKPNDKQLNINVGLSYQNLGNNEKAQQYFAKAEKM